MRKMGKIQIFCPMQYPVRYWISILIFTQHLSSESYSWSNPQDCHWLESDNLSNIIRLVEILVLHPKNVHGNKYDYYSESYMAKQGKGFPHKPNETRKESPINSVNFERCHYCEPCMLAISCVSPNSFMTAACALLLAAFHVSRVTWLEVELLLLTFLSLRSSWKWQRRMEDRLKWFC
jgi:hypothetical protein